MSTGQNRAADQALAGVEDSVVSYAFTMPVDTPDADPNFKWTCPNELRRRQILADLEVMASSLDLINPLSPKNLPGLNQIVELAGTALKAHTWEDHHRETVLNHYRRARHDVACILVAKAYSKVTENLDLCADYDAVVESIRAARKSIRRHLKETFWNQTDVEELHQMTTRLDQLSKAIAGQLEQCRTIVRQELALSQVAFVRRMSITDYSQAYYAWKGEKQKRWYQNEDERQFANAMIILDRVKADKRVEYKVREDASVLRLFCRKELGRSDRKLYQALPYLAEYTELSEYPSMTCCQLEEAARRRWKTLAPSLNKNAFHLAKK